MGHFGIHKTLNILYEYFYWSYMKYDVQSICDKCITRRQVKSKVKPHGFYTPLPLPTYSWIDICLDFILGLPSTKVVEIESLLWWIGLVRWHTSLHTLKTNDATHIVDLFFKEVIHFDSLPNSIMSDCDVKFLFYFLAFILKRIGN